MAIPKYSKLEIERRWLVDLEKLGDLGEPCARIMDRYLLNSRLRLRRVESVGEVQFKLCKKYGGDEPFEAITNIYLDRAEYNALAKLSALELSKSRFKFAEGSLDLYDYTGRFLAIYEVEFESVEEAEAYSPPHFAGEELGRDSDYTGFDIAKKCWRDSGKGSQK